MKTCFYKLFEQLKTKKKVIGLLLFSPFAFKSIYNYSKRNSLLFENFSNNSLQCQEGSRQKKNEVIEFIDNEKYTEDITKFTENFYISPDSNKNQFLFFCGNNAKALTQQIARELNSPLGKILIEKKSKSSESSIQIMENVSNRNVVFISSLSAPVNDNLMEMLFTISTLRRSSAKKIIVVIPYFGYSIKITKDSESNYPLYASLITKLIQAMGADQIITVNIPSKHITGYASIPIIDLDMSGLGISYFVEKLKNKQILNNPIIISPHVTSVFRAKKFQEMLNKNGFEAG